MLLFWACGCITPMGPCICVNVIVAYTFLRKEASVSEPILKIGRYLLAAAILIFWIGQFFAQLGSVWNSSSSMSQLLYTDDITSWQLDRILSFAATALTFVLLAPLFKPLESSVGIHALFDSWLSFNVSSKPILTLLHIVGCVNACIWAGLGPTLLVLPALCLTCYALIKCVHRLQRIPASFLLACYIVLLQVARGLTLSLLLAVADSLHINFGLLFQVGLTTTEISTPVGSVFVYDANRHVFLRFLGWLACLILSFQWRKYDKPLNPMESSNVELRPTQENSVLVKAAAHSFVLFANKFSAESVRFSACVVMYFVGLNRIDFIHAVIFLVAVLYRLLIFTMKRIAKSSEKIGNMVVAESSKKVANLWLWSIMAAYTTVVACLFLIFNLSFVDAPQSSAFGLGQQKDSVSKSWRNFLPIVGVMVVCNLLMAHSIHVLQAQPKQQSSRKIEQSLSEPLLRKDADIGSSVVGEVPESASFFSRVFNFITHVYEFFMRDYFRFVVYLVLMLRGVGAFSVKGYPSLLRHGYLVLFWALVTVVAYHQQWNGSAARWTKRLWPCLIIYAVLVIGIRYLYWFVSDSFQYVENIKDFERAFGLISSISSIQSDVFTYFASDAALVVLFFVQDRRFRKLQKSSTWEWPESPLSFRFPQIEGLYENFLSVHGEKGFLVSLIAAALVNGVTVIGLVWTAFFIVVVLSRTALRSSWAVAVVMSVVYCSLAVISPMPLFEFPGQVKTFADPCDTNCLMGFVGFQAITPYNLDSCSSYPFYCKNIVLSDQIFVSLCIAVSAAFMRLGDKCVVPYSWTPWTLIFSSFNRYREKNTSASVAFNEHPASIRYESNSDYVPSNESNKSHSHATLLPSNPSSVESNKSFSAYPTGDVLRSSEIFCRTTSALLIVLHNAFYAFAFELFVISTCMTAQVAR
jgi:hypothetical protein